MGGGGGQTMELLKKATQEARDAPQMWAGRVKEQILGLGFSVSELQVYVHWQLVRDLFVGVQVDVFVRIGYSAELQGLFESSKKECDIKNRILELRGEGVPQSCAPALGMWV